MKIFRPAPTKFRRARWRPGVRAQRALWPSSLSRPARRGAPRSSPAPPAGSQPASSRTRRGSPAWEPSETPLARKVPWAARGFQPRSLSSRAAVPLWASNPPLTRARIGDTLHDGNGTRGVVVNAFTDRQSGELKGPWIAPAGRRLPHALPPPLEHHARAPHRRRPRPT